MKAEYLVKGLPGHPLHPPLTDVTIGAYAFAAVAAVLAKAGVADRGFSSAWWLALVVGLCSTALTATTGFVDWIELDWGSDRWRAATLHMTAMLCASGVFLAAALVGHRAYARHDVSILGLVLTLVGFGTLLLGGWLGGGLVYVHGTRVLTGRD